MGMKIEVTGTITYTVDLTDEEVDKVRKRVKKKEKENGYPTFDSESSILEAVKELHDEDEISLYEGGKYTESDFCTESINWSEFEEKEPEEILNEE